MLLKFMRKIWVIIYALLLVLSIQFSLTHAQTDKGEELDQLWMNQEKVLNDSRVGSMGLESAKEAILDYMLKSGAPESNLLAATYAIKGNFYRSKNKNDKALWCFESALEISPSYMPAAKGLVVTSFQKGVPALFFALGDYFKALTISLQNPWKLILTVGNLASIFMNTVLFLLLSVVSTLVIRYFPLMMNDLREKLPETFPAYIAPILLLAIFVIPFIFGLGLAWLVIFGFIGTVGYLSFAERRLVWVALIGLALLVPVDTIRVAVLYARNTGFLKVMEYSISSGYSKDALAAIEKHKLENPQDSRPYFIAGLLQKRGGKYFESLKEYIEYTRRNPSDANGHINLGNIYFILNNLGEAISEYRKAESRDSSNPAIYYNLSKAYLHQFKFQQATEMLSKASRLDQDFVTHKTEIQSSEPYRMLVDVVFPKSWLWDEFPGLIEKAKLIQNENWKSLGKGLNIQGTITATAISILLMLIFPIIKKKWDLSFFCVMCGQPTVLSMRKTEGKNRKFCTHCQLVFLKKGQVEQKVRDRKMREINNRNRIRWTSTFALAILYPGTGEVFTEHCLRGGILLVIWSVILGTIVSCRHLTSWNYNVPAIGQYLYPGIFAFLIVIVYLLSIFITIKKEDV